jgi:hypothetical protein
MRITFVMMAVAPVLTGLLLLPTLAEQPKGVHARDGSGVFGYKHTPIQPWSGYHVHDPDRPAPKRVDPGGAAGVAGFGEPPSDATVLFDGQDLSKWRPNKWVVRDGYAECTQGLLVTREEFSEGQLHIEWRVPDPPVRAGNNGIRLLNAYEIQIFDSHTTAIYPDGQAAAVYAQTPPMVNACRKPGEWQTYDIVFTAPVFEDGKQKIPARLTLFHNGVLVHHNQEIYGDSPHKDLPKPLTVKNTKGPIVLLAHHSPVRFRNIWIRPIRAAAPQTETQDHKRKEG